MYGADIRNLMIHTMFYRMVILCRRLAPFGFRFLFYLRLHQSTAHPNEHPEIFQGESLKEIEKGRNSDWSKEYYIRQKAEKLETMTMELASVSASVEAQEEILDTLNEQTEECIQKLVDNKAQKEFMRYALLQEPKPALGKLVSEAWKKFKKWWDEKQRPAVEAEVRESVMGHR